MPDFNHGDIQAFADTKAPPAIAQAAQSAGKADIVEPTYPYAQRLKRSEYDRDFDLLQHEMVKLQKWIRDTGQRIVVVFEGRDSAGKGGTIKRLRENLNPRNAHVVALAKPNNAERGEFYFQRYLDHLPTKGEITFFDRSWYNRGVVEHVFGFCDPEDREKWFGQVPVMEDLLVKDGIKLFKIWLNIGQATQLKRLLAREADPLKHWKLSWIDAAGLSKWDDYSTAIKETLQRTDTAVAPWHVIRADDKRRARLNALRVVLNGCDYPNKNNDIVAKVDATIVQSPQAIYG